ncbi:MAG: ribonuclease H-like YkuK family protein, partial [Limnochordia bacterium]
SNGATKSLVKEVVCMVNGSGFLCKVKPDSYGASSVADRYTK